ncbi:MAG: inositol 2-dehydrogenase [Deltaproteobacteria bacterium]|nr:inositol 2-dehydrogenase [Deltaproteobacteria bacterium]
MTDVTAADPVRLGLLGAGRIGRTHARSIAATEGARLVAVADPVEAAVAAVVRMTGAQVASPEELLNDPAIEGVLIATPTDLHADLIERAADAGKAVFCEKPLDLDLSRAQQGVAAAARRGVPLMIGFNRRFDPSFRRLREEIDGGRIGDVELVQITSRDPAPPPLAYIERSGGLFRDMMIHDLDMARFLVGESIVEVSAAGSALVDEAIGDAGDVDTAVAVLRSSGGRLCVISNSRRAVYGYDQRIEVHGSAGMLSAGNPVATTVTRADGSGFVTDPLNDFFMDRYADAYRLEMAAFCAVVRGGDVPYPNGHDGLAALAIADAASESLATGRTVPVKRLDSTP